MEWCYATKYSAAESPVEYPHELCYCCRQRSINEKCVAFGIYLDIKYLSLWGSSVEKEADIDIGVDISRSLSEVEALQRKEFLTMICLKTVAWTLVGRSVYENWLFRSVDGWKHLGGGGGGGVGKAGNHNGMWLPSLNEEMKLFPMFT